MSLGTASLIFEGRTVNERKLDAIVWGHKQLYVVAAANEGESGFSNFGAAKSSFAVGAVADSGEVASFSSRGPTGDGRLVPQVTAVGVGVNSAKGAGSRTAYKSLQGTSMAAPAVAGVAALLMDAVPATRNSPAAVRALLMATAIKPEPIVANASQFALNNTDGPKAWQNQYGLGKVSARTAVLERNSADGWTNGFRTAKITSGNYRYADIVVPAGASRLDIVVTWDEPPADTIRASVLNDFDLWVDLGKDCEASAAKCGEYSSRSRVDNVEWVIIRDPQPGTYRAKIVADQVYSDNQAAIAWNVVRGTAMPQLQINAARPTIRAGQNERFEVSLTVTADEYVAAGVTVQPACRRETAEDSPDPDCASWARAAFVSSGSSVTRDDAIDRRAERDPFDHLLSLGELAAGEERTVKLAFRNQRWGQSHRLYFVASAWNAEGDSATVGIDLYNTAHPDDPGVPVAVDGPSHATLEDAFAVHKSQGQVDFDLLLSSRAPGEPLLPPDEPSAKTKVLKPFWFTWRAARTANTRYAFVIENKDAEDSALNPLKWDVFRGGEISDPEHIFPQPDVVPYSGTSLYYDGKAKEGDTYHFRISTTSVSTKPYVLRWASRDTTPPSNDQFANPLVISGRAGRQTGDNGGATLEFGEDLAGMAASAWYRWRAPSDGHWRFRVRETSINSSLRVLVFEGDNIRNLRLVSGAPRDYADFLAGRGETYRIAVVATDAEDKIGGRYDLSWSAFNTSRKYLVAANDHFAWANEIVGSQGRYPLNSRGYWTVEPDEPESTGARTRWLSWTPETDGEYTFRLHNLTPVLLDLSFFGGSSLNDLKLLGASDRQLRSRPELKVAVEADQTYSIAIGLQGQYAYRASPSPRGLLEWGPTPANDDLDNAERIAGSEGSLTVSTKFATVETGEPSDVAGHQSLWWEWRAEKTEWRRFWVDNSSSERGMLSLYRRGSGGKLELVRTSELSFALNGASEVVFRAVGGGRYLLRLTSLNSGNGEVVVHWAASDTPIWLRYVGHVVDGDHRLVDKGMDVRRPGSMVLNSSGDKLYVAGDYGLATFLRNESSGTLTPAGFVWSGEVGCDSDSNDCDPLYVDRSTPLLWDSQRTRLYSTDAYFEKFHKFLPDEQGRSLNPGGSVRSTDGVVLRQNVDRLLMDADGRFIHMLEMGTSVLDTFSLNADGQSTYVEGLAAAIRADQQTDAWREVEHLAGLRNAVVADDGNHLYLVTNKQLLTFNRDRDKGRLDLVSRNWWRDGTRFTSIAFTPDQSLLQVLGAHALYPVPVMMLYRLDEDTSQPDFRAQLREFSAYPFAHPTYANNDVQVYCTNILARNDSLSVDIFCYNTVYTATWDIESEKLYATDYVSPNQADRFGNEIPSFGFVRGAVASPDGRHVYVTGSEGDQILVFERIGGH